MRTLSTTAVDFQTQFNALLAQSPNEGEAVQQRVRAILHAVREQGDAAVVDYTNQFDRRSAQHMGELEITQTQLQQALARISPELRLALEAAAARIRTYAQQQKILPFQYTDAHGNTLGQQVTPLDRVGIYVPGGKAAYPSSVLMNAIPAHVAGVAEIIMVSPAPDGVLNDTVLAAAAIAGVTRVFSIGGAQAVGALAYGTQTVPAVDKIVGPGNAYVAAAKKQVFGTVGIDMIAGPSEILIVCDGKTDPDWIALDLFSQAEHDEDAQAILLTPDAAFLAAVQASIDTLLPQQPRQAIIEAALANRGALIHTRNIEEAIEIANQIATEHLELSVDNPEALLPLVRHAGAVFMGRHTPEAFGDYCAGPNHVLPTVRTARFSSPLGVYDFQKRTSLIYASAQGATVLANISGTLADSEGLNAHAMSARARL